MTTTHLDYEQAAEAARKAQERAEKARQKAEQAAVDHAAAVDQRRRETARQTIQAFDEPSLNAAVSLAEKELRQATLSDPVWLAVSALYAARLRKANAHTAVINAAARLEIEPPVRSFTAGEVVIDDLMRMALSNASNSAADEQDALDEANEHYAQTGDRQ